MMVLILAFALLGGFAAAGRYLWASQRLRIQDCLIQTAEKMYMPGVFYYHNRLISPSPAEKILQIAIDSQPILHYMRTNRETPKYIEDEETIAMILKEQANEEHAVDENGNLIPNDTEQVEIAPNEAAVNENLNAENLQDFDYLLSHFYVVDSTTTIDAAQLNYQDLMSRSMKLSPDTEGPKILIYHTHSQEAFADSAPGDPGTSIVGIGSYLTELLNAKGIAAIHDEGVYDVIDGRLDRSMAYDYAKDNITAILAENPSIEVVIDLHRDGVSEDTHLVTDVGGKPTARIMFFNGLSRTTTNGDIEYLYNPYIQDNLSFSFQMQLACEQKYPGWARRIYLRAYRYNLHLMPKDLLIEAGAQTNTVEEMRNAMELLADTLYSVLTG